MNQRNQAGNSLATLPEAIPQDDRHRLASDKIPGPASKDFGSDSGLFFHPGKVKGLNFSAESLQTIPLDFD
jgi:hypothetical protein